MDMTGVTGMQFKLQLYVYIYNTYIYIYIYKFIYIYIYMDVYNVVLYKLHSNCNNLNMKFK